MLEALRLAPVIVGLGAHSLLYSSSLAAFSEVLTPDIWTNFTKHLQFEIVTTP